MSIMLFVYGLIIAALGEVLFLGILAALAAALCFWLAFKIRKKVL